MSEALFARDQEIEDVLRAEIGWFLTDLNRILREYWIMAVARLTDSPATMNRKNATIAALNDALIDAGLSSTEIVEACARIHDYRALIGDVRNKRIAHRDHDAHIGLGIGLNRGEHTESDLRSFLQNLNRYTDLVGEALGIGPLDYSAGTPCEGDAATLVRIVEQYHRGHDDEE